VKSLPGDWSGAVVFAAGTPWDGQRLPDQHIAERLSARVPVLYVDPPEWRGRPWSSAAGRLDLVRPGLARLTPYGVPGIERPLLHTINDRLVRRAIRQALAVLHARARVLVLCSCHELMGSADEELSVFYGTDDFVAGTSLARIPVNRLRRQEARHLGNADHIVAVSPELTDGWRARGFDVTLIANGVDDQLFAGTDAACLPGDVLLAGPIVGFVGFLSNRIDLGLLETIAARGRSLLLVGPRQLSFEIDRIARLLDFPNVAWVGPKAFEELPSYLRVMDVGITPYTDTAFNRASFPLKTLEYLAAGRGAVATDLPSTRWLDSDLVRIATGREGFADAVDAALAEPRTDELVRARRELAHRNSWDARADEFAQLLGLPERTTSSRDRLRG